MTPSATRDNAASTTAPPLPRAIGRHAAVQNAPILRGQPRPTTRLRTSNAARPGMDIADRQSAVENDSLFHDNRSPRPPSARIAGFDIVRADGEWPGETALGGGGTDGDAV